MWRDTKLLQQRTKQGPHSEQDDSRGNVTCNGQRHQNRRSRKICVGFNMHYVTVDLLSQQVHYIWSILCALSYEPSWYFFGVWAGIPQVLMYCWASWRWSSHVLRSFLLIRITLYIICTILVNQSEAISTCAMMLRSCLRSDSRIQEECSRSFSGHFWLVLENK